MKCRQSTKNAKTAGNTTILVTSIKGSVLKTLTTDEWHNTAESMKENSENQKKLRYKKDEREKRAFSLE